MPDGRRGLVAEVPAVNVLRDARRVTAGFCRLVGGRTHAALLGDLHDRFHVAGHLERWHVLLLQIDVALPCASELGASQASHELDPFAERSVAPGRAVEHEVGAIAR